MLPSQLLCKVTRVISLARPRAFTHRPCPGEFSAASVPPHLGRHSADCAGKSRKSKQSCCFLESCSEGAVTFPFGNVTNLPQPLYPRLRTCVKKFSWPLLFPALHKQIGAQSRTVWGRCSIAKTEQHTMGTNISILGEYLRRASGLGTQTRGLLILAFSLPIAPVSLWGHAQALLRQGPQL